ncbi:2a88e24e-5101-4d22-8a93-ce1ee90c4278 [Thermothielavioides terrestris]|uniref:2a88e24e-5101-4d22-8a93-ce1ee90c4278 n=1 Tax=Thermothielavioides terrestris TaxID=2587410 RepID=A0A3S4AY71_9PEZI|nr:2a88e24e-5101-4d22-8a93-ce1ee90c4278 [Thermothielavioides terrestris]
MAVIYHDSLECLVCRRRPPQGFLYRCTVDREPLILDAESKGYSAAFDNCGMAFAGEMTLGKFGADARSNPHNLFNELTPEQLASYTPEQLAILVSQRENVHRTIAEDRRRWAGSAAVAPSKRRIAGDDDEDEDDDEDDDDKPWVPDWRSECQYRP